MKINIKKVAAEALVPQYATSGAACFDLHACMPEGASVLAKPGTPAHLKTGLAFQVPEGFVMLVFSRSGHGFKNDVRLANCVGVIDSDYRGEVQVKLTNDHFANTLEFKHGDRVAQAMIVPVIPCSFNTVDELSETERGTGGLGSTGGAGRNFIGSNRDLFEEA